MILLHNMVLYHDMTLYQDMILYCMIFYHMFISAYHGYHSLDKFSILHYAFLCHLDNFYLTWYKAALWKAIQCIKGDNCETVKINCGPILHELDITYNDCCYISSSVLNFYHNYLLKECHEGLRCTFSLEVSHRYCKFLGKVSNQTKDYKRISNLKFET